MQGLRNIGIERLVALILVLFAIAELYAARRLALSAEFTLGPGATPMIYGFGLLVFSFILLLRPSRGAAGGGEEAARISDGVVFFVLLVALAVGIEFVGFLISTAAFAFLSLMYVMRIGLPKSALFAVLWSAGLFYVFKQILQVPLEPGILFS